MGKSCWPLTRRLTALAQPSPVPTTFEVIKVAFYASGASCPNGATTTENVDGFVNFQRVGTTLTVEVPLKKAAPNTTYQKSLRPATETPLDPTHVRGLAVRGRHIDGP